MAEPVDRAPVIAPPPLLFAVLVVAGVILDHFVPLPLMNVATPVRIGIGVVVFIASIVLGGSAMRQFRAHREHPSPYRATNTIIDTGIYSRTRNPIYLSFLITAAAVAIFANSWWVLIAEIPLAIVIHFGVILREEKYLSAKFGAPYDDYRRRVRRWI